MTRTEERYASNPSILAIGELTLHRETVMELTGDVKGRARRWSGNQNTLGCTYACPHTKHCTHKCG
jgi:hypothetical protein